MKNNTTLESLMRKHLFQYNKNIKFLIGQLVNSMQHYENQKQFVKHMNKQLKIKPQALKTIYRDYWRLPPKDRHDMFFDWEKWLSYRIQV